MLCLSAHEVKLDSHHNMLESFMWYDS